MSRDSKYCGVDEHKILGASPTFVEGRSETFTHYINERCAIQKRRYDHLSPPWTEDRVLRDYRFTNISRKDDRVSKWFIKNIAEESSLTTRYKFYNTLVFRAFNKIETAESLNLPFTVSTIEDLRNLIDEMRSRGYNKHFGTAYFQSGLKGAWKTDEDTSKRMVDMLEWVIDNGYYRKIKDTKNQKECFEMIKEIPGFADFMAYQVFVDLTYIPEFPFTDTEFTVSGPGCNKGIDALFESKDGMTYEECIFWIRDNQDEFNLCKTVSVMDIENCFCEFSKYVGIQLNPKKRMRKFN